MLLLPGCWGSAALQGEGAPRPRRPRRPCRACVRGGPRPGLPVSAPGPGRAPRPPIAAREPLARRRPVRSPAAPAHRPGSPARPPARRPPRTDSVGPGVSARGGRGEQRGQQDEQPGGAAGHGHGGTAGGTPAARQPGRALASRGLWPSPRPLPPPIGPDAHGPRLSRLSLVHRLTGPPPRLLIGPPSPPRPPSLGAGLPRHWPRPPGNEALIGRLAQPGAPEAPEPPGRCGILVERGARLSVFGPWFWGTAEVGSRKLVDGAGAGPVPSPASSRGVPRAGSKPWASRAWRPKPRKIGTHSKLKMELSYPCSINTCVHSCIFSDTSPSFLFAELV